MRPELRRIIVVAVNGVAFHGRSLDCAHRSIGNSVAMINVFMKHSQQDALYGIEINIRVVSEPKTVPRNIEAITCILVPAPCALCLPYA